MASSIGIRYVASFICSPLLLRKTSPVIRLRSAAVSARNFNSGKTTAMSNSSRREVLGLTQPDTADTTKVPFSAKEVDVVRWKGDLLAIGVTEKDMVRSDGRKFENILVKKLDDHLNGQLGEASSEEGFSGTMGQSMVLRFPGHNSKRIGLFGLGQSASTTLAYRRLGEAIADAAKATQASLVGVALASIGCAINEESRHNIASAIASGTMLGMHDDNRYKSDSKKHVLESVEMIGFGTGPEVEKKLRHTEIVSSAVIFGRDLVNSPANVLTPAVLAEEASKVASMHCDVLSATILNADQCKDLRMGAYLGVAAASANPPHFIHLCYKPTSGDVKVKVALVGKGLTFDSGGYNIKTGTGCSIELMKCDMGGSAAVLGAAKAIAQIKPSNIEVHFIVASCENMISGTGMRPGDILTASNGKTIEVNNTDAEGRLTLADALVYACKQGVEKIIDLATLTGACVVALGPSIAGAFTASDDLAKEVFEAADVAGEKLWRMPLEESYWESMKSWVADMVNTGGRQGGAITAALFLNQFVDEKVKWMHIDMAGPVWSEKKHCSTGFGIATLVEWILHNAS